MQKEAALLCTLCNMKVPSHMWLCSPAEGASPNQDITCQVLGAKEGKAKHSQVIYSDDHTSDDYCTNFIFLFISGSHVAQTGLPLAA